MKRFVVAVAVSLSILGFAPGVAVTQVPSHADTPMTLDGLAWLVGNWVRHSPRGESTETWTRVSDNTMEGMAFSISGGSIRISEHLRIERLGNEVFYTAKPGENPMPTPFRLGVADGTQFVFENPDHDFPQTISYTRIGEDDLLVRIEGLIDGALRGMDFRFVRKVGTGELQD